MALAVLAAISVIGASGTLGVLVVQRGDVSAVIALAGVLATAGIAVMLGADWRYRDEALRASERERRTIRSSRTALRPGGFADKVNQLYLRYLKRCAPSDDRERAAWLTDAYVPLCRLRNDLVEAYRERPASTDEVKWLIRFQIRDLRRRWARGEPLDPRPGVPVLLKLSTTAGAATSLTALTWVMQSALRQNVLRATGAFVALAFAGAVAATLGLQIMAERKRVLVAETERERRLNSYRAEYLRWLKRLTDRPTNMEMAQWLDCDRRLLLNSALLASCV